MLKSYEASGERSGSRKADSAGSAVIRILILSPRQCWPPQSGAKLRDYYFARALGQQANVSYAYFIDPGSAPL
jgi:hypothetical protein